MPTQDGSRSRRTVELDYRRLFESLPGLYMVLDANFDLLTVSDAYAAATMIVRDDVVGRNLFEVFPDNPDDPNASGTANLRASLQRVVRELVVDVMAVQKYDVRRPESEGGGFEVRYWSPVNSPVLAPDGTLEYIVHQAEDVTEFVRLRQLGDEHARETHELRSQAERMEVEVYQRAQQVSRANRELQHAKEQVEQLYERTKQLDEIKTQFFANVSHELRTPLALILGPLERIAADPSIPSATRERLEVATRNGRLLLRHVNDLLDVAKLEAGKLGVDYADVDAADVVRVAASHFDSLARERHIAFVIDVAGPIPAQLDVPKVDRVLVNLLSNAFKFSPDGTRIGLRARTDSETERLVVEVEDQGPGIPEEERVRVFERFRQIEGGERRKVGGTGLGLAIAKDFVELHGGSLTVTAGASGGARFVVELPLRAPRGATVERGPSLAPSDAGGAGAQLARELLGNLPHAAVETLAADDERPLVLVVEDNPDMNRFVRESLEPAVRTAAAFDGAEGLRRARELHPDLVVSDMMMPGTSGEDLLLAMRADADLRETPVLLLTAKADEESRVRLLRAGARDYVQKPFSADELRARVRNLVEARLASKEARRLYDELEAKSRRLEAVGIELAASNAELEAFGHSVAHDLRAPLRSIDGFSQALLEDAADVLDENARGHLGRIRKSASRMNELIDDLLTLSRITRQPLEVEPVDLGPIARQVNAVLARDQPARVVELSLAGDLHTVGDPRLLTIVLENLLANAWKFTRGREVAHIEMGRSDEATFFVRDDGAGFDERYAHKLFQTFQRLHAPSEFEGTGIGLATVLRIVRRHGGNAWATGKVGEGATFSFSLGSPGKPA